MDYLWFSTDGLQWSKATLPKSLWISDVTWDGTRFIAVGSAVLTSPDGIHWSEQATPPILLYSVFSQGSRILATGTLTQIWSADNLPILETTGRKPPLLLQAIQRNLPLRFDLLGRATKAP
jgi:hypothetical protein